MGQANNCNAACGPVLKFGETSKLSYVVGNQSGWVGKLTKISSIHLIYPLDPKPMGLRRSLRVVQSLAKSPHCQHSHACLVRLAPPMGLRRSLRTLREPPYEFTRSARASQPWQYPGSPSILLQRALASARRSSPVAARARDAKAAKPRAPRIQAWRNLLDLEHGLLFLQ